MYGLADDRAAGEACEGSAAVRAALAGEARREELVARLAQVRLGQACRQPAHQPARAKAARKGGDGSAAAEPHRLERPAELLLVQGAAPAEHLCHGHSRPLRRPHVALRLAPFPASGWRGRRRGRRQRPRRLASRR